MIDDLPVINAHNGWDQLEEVWLGDVYPSSWYDHLDPEIKDTFYEITEKTQEDLRIIEQKLLEFGVVVQRPKYLSIDDYIRPIFNDSNEYQLIKPSITPRDNFAVIGDTFFMPKWKSISMPWQYVLDEYQQQGGKINTKADSDSFFISGANIVRAGQDLYIDTQYTQENRGVTQELERKEFEENYAEIFKDYRVHFLSNGGHIDGCLAVLKPGLILCNEYFSEYDKTFPNWHLLKRFAPEFLNSNTKFRPHGSPDQNQKWWLPGVDLPKSFNKHVIQHALDWVGDFTETYFEINCLSINCNNVMVLGEDDFLFRELERHGITAHSVPFRCRTFWDGGLHCLTLDIRRQSKMENYFPERDDASPIFY